MKPTFLKMRKGQGTVLVQLIRRENGIVSGKRVTKEGETWEKDCGEFIQNEIVIGAERDVICEMVMNNHYGALERAAR